MKQKKGLIYNRYNFNNTDMTELLNQLQEELNAIQADVTKFTEKGNKAAGTRIRKSMQTIKGLAQDVRVAVSAANNA